MGAIIGLDLGTTNAKAVLMSVDGTILGLASSGYALYSPNPGWAEQNPLEVWIAATNALSKLVQDHPGESVLGLCLSGAMHTLFPMDRDGIPLAASMSWADQRAAPQVAPIRANANPLAVYRRTGCPINAFYYPARLNWWKNAGRQSGWEVRFSAIKDWVLFKLTGQWAADFSMASSTGLLDIRRFEWDSEALGLAGVSPEQLPPLVSPKAVAGQIHPESARLTGLKAGLPVIAGASDGGLANLGSGAVLPNQMVITVGTSGAVRRILKEPWFDRAARTWCYVLTEDRWFAGGAINSAGLAVQWVREKFYPDLQGAAGFQAIMEDAACTPVGADGLVFLPYFAGERSPHWNPELRASLVGMSLEHNRRSVARAVLEGVAFCLKDIWQVLLEENPDVAEVRLTGSITQSPVWMQIVADVIGCPVIPVEAADASALGAAVLGGYALGSISRLESLSAQMAKGLVIQPDPLAHRSYQALHNHYQELFRLVEPAYTHHQTNQSQDIHE